MWFAFQISSLRTWLGVLVRIVSWAYRRLRLLTAKTHTHCTIRHRTLVESLSNPKPSTLNPNPYHLAHLPIASVQVSQGAEPGEGFLDLKGLE